MSKPVLAYWFSDGDHLQYGDSRIPAVGVTHTHDGPVELCKRGLHASVCPFDALRYAPGNTLWRVEIGGAVDVGDKIVGTSHTYLARLDAEPLLWAFARWCALQVIDLWDCPPVVREYLMTGDESLRAAARAAAWTAARAAAWTAARAAAWTAARDAAWTAAWDAASAAAWTAASAAARDAQRAEFRRLVDAAFAAREAA